jgi:hypothetical protein
VDNLMKVSSWWVRLDQTVLAWKWWVVGNQEQTRLVGALQGVWSVVNNHDPAAWFCYTVQLITWVSAHMVNDGCSWLLLTKIVDSSTLISNQILGLL